MANWDVLYVGEGRQVDGVDETEVRRMLSEGELNSDDCLRRSGETRWRRVSELRRGGAKQAEEDRKRQEAEEEEVQEETSQPPAMMAGAAVVAGAPGTVASHAHIEE